MQPKTASSWEPEAINVDRACVYPDLNGVADRRGIFFAISVQPVAIFFDERIRVVGTVDFPL